MKKHFTKILGIVVLSTVLIFIFFPHFASSNVEVDYIGDVGEFEVQLINSWIYFEAKEVRIYSANITIDGAKNVSVYKKGHNDSYYNSNSTDRETVRLKLVEGKALHFRNSNVDAMVPDGSIRLRLSGRLDIEDAKIEGGRLTPNKDEFDIRGDSFEWISIHSISGENPTDAGSVKLEIDDDSYITFESVSNNDRNLMATYTSELRLRGHANHSDISISSGSLRLNEYKYDVDRNDNIIVSTVDKDASFEIDIWENNIQLHGDVGSVKLNSQQLIPDFFAYWLLNDPEKVFSLLTSLATVTLVVVTAINVCITRKILQENKKYVKKISEQVDESRNQINELRKDRERDSVVAMIAGAIDPIVENLDKNKEIIPEIEGGSIAFLEFQELWFKGDGGAGKDFVKRHKELANDIAKYLEKVESYNSDVRNIKENIKEKVEEWIESSEELERYIPKFEEKFDSIKDGKVWLKSNENTITGAIMRNQPPAKDPLIKDILDIFKRELSEIRDYDEIKNRIEKAEKIACDIELYIQSTQLNTRLNEKRKEYMGNYDIWEGEVEAVKDNVEVI